MDELRKYINIINESELIEPVTTTKQVKNLDLDKLYRTRRKLISKNDAGVSAYAKDINPHEIKLGTFEPVEKDKDPKWQYFKAIEPLQGENPYVPTVYEINIVTADNLPGELQKPSYQMQRLLSWQQVPTLPLFQTCFNIIDKFDIGNTSYYIKSTINKIKKQYQELENHILYTNKRSNTDPEFPQGDARNMDPEQRNFLTQEKVSKENCVDFVLTLISQALEGKITTHDNYLSEVLAIIDKIGNIGGFSGDLHTGNIMFRPTGNTYQLVITDPLVL